MARIELACGAHHWGTVFYAAAAAVLTIYLSRCFGYAPVTIYPNFLNKQNPKKYWSKYEMGLKDFIVSSEDTGQQSPVFAAICQPASLRETSLNFLSKDDPRFKKLLAAHNKIFKSLCMTVRQNCHPSSPINFVLFCLFKVWHFCWNHSFLPG